MNRLIYILLLGLLSFAQNSYAQQWGYATLIAPGNSTTVSLLDTNSAVIKAWTGLQGNTGYSCYLTEGGDLWRTVKATGASFTGGGICGRIQKVAYNGTLLFDYQINTAEMISHHDICPMPNGNVLVIIYHKKTAAEVQAAGGTANATRWTEIIYELEPTGPTTANIVWEWHLWDHLVQNVDPNKANYQSSIVNNPQLLNINYQNNMADWVHMNGIDYNPGLDQIVVSSHFLNEMWVIDHSTTTAQAASHSGGNGGKGGDFLYRWGNPAAYGASGTTVFNVMHDAHWVPAGAPNAGYLVGFNNKGVSNSASAVDLFNPPVSGYNYTLTPGQAYAPATYAIRHAVSGYSSNMGNSQQLPNGNMLVCVATQAKVYEINANNTQLWSYTGSGSIPQASRYTRCFVESPDVAVLTPSPSLCSGGTTQLDITPSASGPITFTYNWAPAASLSSATVQDPVVSGISVPTTYTVTVTTPGGCTATASILVDVLPGTTVNAGNNVTINIGQTTTLTATGNGTFQWSNGATTASTQVAPSVTTTYTVTITGSNNCTSTDEVTVTVISTPLALSASALPNSICVGESSELNAFASGGAGNYTYAWASNPAGFSSNQPNVFVTPSVTTTYTVTVTSGAGTITATTQVVVSPLPVANAGNNVSIILGQTANLMATGGVSYVWSNGTTTATNPVSPSTTTTYTVTVTNAAGCTQTDEVVVTVTIPPTTALLNAQPSAICVGDATILTATAGGGNGTYSYAWASNPVGFSSNQAAPLVTPSITTTYTVTVTSGNTSATASVTVVVNALPVANAGNSVSIIVGQTANLLATGGLQYAWSNGTNTAVNSVMPTTTTTYTVTVTSAAGCVNTDEVTVIVNLPPVAASVSSSNGAICPNGSAQLSASGSGGTGVYTYTWASNPAGFVSNLANPVVMPSSSTTYTVTITSGNGTATASTTVVVNNAPNANAGGDISIIIGQTANLMATGGVTYVWSNGTNTAANAVNPTITSTYTVTVQDGNGCTATDQVTVTVTGTVLSANPSVNSASICAGGSTLLSANATGGSGNYTYNWASDPAGFSSNLANPAASPLVNTVYSVTISDGIGSSVGSVGVAVLPLPNANAGNDATINFGQNTTLTATGGGSYLWNTGATTATIDVMPLATMTYTVTVTNAQGCTATDNATITVNGGPITVFGVAATPNAVCMGQSVQLAATIVGGTGNVTYSWTSNPAGFVSNASNPTITPTANTAYILTINDGVTVRTDSVLVSVLTLPNVSAGNDVTINFGQSTMLTASGGGTYLWSNGANTATIMVSPQNTATYTVTVTDTNGCTATDEVTVTVAGAPLALSISGVQAICSGQSANISANITGGTGNYFIVWSSIPAGFTTNTASFVVAPSQTTEYQVLVSDGASTLSATTTLVVYPLPAASAGNDVSIPIGGTTALTATGGDFYLWSTGATTSSIMVAPAQSTTYTVTVTNAQGCTATDEVTVTVLIPALTVGLTAIDTELCNGEFTQLFATASGGLGTYTYTWSSDPAGFESTLPDPFVNPTENTTYTVVVSDGASSISVSIAIVVLPLPAQPIISVDSLTLTSSASVGNQWFLYGAPIPGATGQQHEVTLTGAYQVQTVDANGCYSPLSDPIEIIISGTYDLDAVLNWNLVPNPATDVAFLIGDLDKVLYRVSLYNALGCMVLEGENLRTIDLSRVPAGAYWVQVRTERGVAVRKLVVKR
jgi:hypothetical protein